MQVFIFFLILKSHRSPKADEQQTICLLQCKLIMRTQTQLMVLRYDTLNLEVIHPDLNV